MQNIALIAFGIGTLIFSFMLALGHAEASYNKIHKVEQQIKQMLKDEYKEQNCTDKLTVYGPNWCSIKMNDTGYIVEKADTDLYGQPVDSEDEQ